MRHVNTGVVEELGWAEVKKKPRLEDRRRESLFAHHNSVQVILLTKHLKFGPSGPGRVEKRLGKGPWAPQGWAVEASPSEGLHSYPVPSSSLLAPQDQII